MIEQQKALQFLALSLNFDAVALFHLPYVKLGFAH